MTFRQRQLLDFIRAQIETTGIAPTYREMMAAVGAASTSRVAEMVEALINQGQLVREQKGPGKWRNLKLPGEPIAPYADLTRVSTERLREELSRREGASCPPR